MSIRPPPGNQVAAGRIRVDAARAIAKLREYQLADRSAWILEAIRAAVASNATAIALAGDANDVWLAWSGEPWPVADLPRLFDELVSPEADMERHHLRLLAAGVNSALGMDPSFIDVIAVETGGATRTRYRPDVLAEPVDELGDSPLRHVVAEAIEIPVKYRELLGEHRGMLVHLHRRVSLEVLGRFLKRDEPPELGWARSECRDVPVPLEIGDTVLCRDRPDHDIVRVPLDEGLDGFVAVIDPLDGGFASCEFQVAERGVILVRYAIDLGIPKTLPLRVFVDAPRMPTNVARSQVRRDGHPIATAHARAQKMIPRVVEALVEATKDRATAERARAAALAWIACSIGGSNWCWEQVPDLLGPLARLPLLRDATGDPRPLQSGWSGIVYANRAPLDENLREWVASLVWMPPGDPANRLLQGVPFDRAATRRAIRAARRQRDAHARFFDHKPREPVVETRRVPRVRAPLGAPLANSCVDQTVFARMKGEICIYGSERGGELVLLLSGREIERTIFDFQLGFDAVIDAAEITPGDRYRSVRRDSSWKRVDIAMRSAIVRAVEAIVVAGEGKPADGYKLGGTYDKASDAALVRIAMVSAPTLIRGPLSTAAVWPTLDGRWISLQELTTMPAIGIASGDRPMRAISHRTILKLRSHDRQILGTLLKTPLIDYDAVGVPEPDAVLRQFFSTTGVALGVVEDGIRGVIWASRSSTLVVHHAGRELAKVPYISQYTTCSIAVDADAVTPNADWSKILEAGGVTTRNYSMWERALLRGIALALVGSPPPELHNAQTIDLASSQTRALFECIAVRDPNEIIGDDVVRSLKKVPLVRMHGQTWAISIDAALAQLGAAPAAIPYVDATANHVPGFVALACDELFARAVGRLADRKMRDANFDLECRRKEAEHEQRLATHRRQPERALAVTGAFADITVELVHPVARGFVGISSGGIEINIDVEKRPFTRIRIDSPLALVANLELGIDRIDESFARVPDDVRESIIASVTKIAPRLLAEVAKHQPAALLAAPVWPLLASYCATENIDRDMRAALGKVEAFPSVQGARVSLERASDERFILRTTTWIGEWLDAAGDPPTPLDEPIIQVPVLGELKDVVHTLHRGAVVDVTAEVTKLQSDRRMVRGLLPVPTLPDVPAQLKCKLRDLGDIGRKLGHGEIGLVEAAGSMALLHDRGVFVERLGLPHVLPPVLIALEAPELVELARQPGSSQLRALGLINEDHLIEKEVQELAIRLVRKVTATIDASYPPTLRSGLRRAVLARKLLPDEVAGVPLFQRPDLSYVDAPTVMAQERLHGTIWTIPRLTAFPSDSRPLDDTRMVIHLPPDQRLDAEKLGWRVIDATNELAQDSKARRNRERPLATSLDLPMTGTLGSVALDGDGTTGVRGVVALLHPAATAFAGVRVHRGMRPLGTLPDTAEVPTVAVIDDARFVPDRTWENPLEDGTWHDAITRIHAATKKLVAKVTAPPAHAVVWLDITPLAEPPKQTHTKISGTMWLTDPGAFVRVVTVINELTITYTPEKQAPISGSLLVYHGAVRSSEIEDICERAHTRMLIHLVENRATIDPVVFAGHLAAGLACNRILPSACGDVRFTCFTHPVDAATMHGILHDPMVFVPVVSVMPQGDAELALVDDGSQLARIVLHWLGGRAVYSRPTSILAPPPAAIVPASRPEEPAHPLQDVASTIHARLAQVGVTGYWVQIDRKIEKPMVRFERGLWIAGACPRLAAIANALSARSPWGLDAIDAIVAHALTVLNVALVEVTDVTEAHALAGLISKASRSP